MARWLKINAKGLLRFFDEKPVWSKKRATGVVSLVGEDLNAACFQHYLESRGARAAVLTVTGWNQPLPVTTGKPKGPRLDRWIKVTWPDESKTVFQTEIKNWSAHAYGGEILSVSATSEEVTNYKQARWEVHWDSQRKTLKGPNTAKVLVRMRPPCGVDENIIRPLLIFWEAIGPRIQADDHLFRMCAPTCDFPFSLPATWPKPYKFPELWVFSVSSYLRSIQGASIELNMPEASDRLRILSCLFATGTQ